MGPALSEPKKRCTQDGEVLPSSPHSKWTAATKPTSRVLRSQQCERVASRLLPHLAQWPKADETQPTRISYPRFRVGSYSRVYRSSSRAVTSSRSEMRVRECMWRSSVVFLGSFGEDLHDESMVSTEYQQSTDVLQADSKETGTRLGALLVM